MANEYRQMVMVSWRKPIGLQQVLVRLQPTIAMSFLNSPLLQSTCSPLHKCLCPRPAAPPKLDYLNAFALKKSKRLYKCYGLVTFGSRRINLTTAEEEADYLICRGHIPSLINKDLLPSWIFFFVEKLLFLTNVSDSKNLIRHKFSLDLVAVLFVGPLVLTDLKPEQRQIEASLAPPPPVQFLSFSCSFGGNLAK